MPDKLAAELRKAAADLAEALKRRNRLIVKALLEADASTVEVAKHADMSPPQVMRIGHQHGWPTDEQRASWADQEVMARRMRENRG